MSQPANTGLYLLSPAEPTGVDRALWAEREGYGSVWVPDGGGKMHALTLAGALAAKTERVKIVLGVVPVYTHTPAVLASGAMTLAHLAPGRIVMGLGASSHAMMEGWHGIPFVKPLTRVRETVQVLRRMLDGERVDFAGETLSTRGFRLNPPPSHRVPIYLAALRPRMLELAGEVADGVVLHLAPLQALPKMLEHVATGARRAGRALSDVDVVCRFNVLLSEDLAAGLREARRALVPYYSTPVYNKFLAWCGFEQEARQISEGFQEGNREKTNSALSDALLQQLCVVGDADGCRAQVRAYLAAGVDTPVIHPSSADPAAAQRAMEAFTAGNFA